MLTLPDQILCLEKKKSCCELSWTARESSCIVSSIASSHSGTRIHDTHPGKIEIRKNLPWPRLAFLALEILLSHKVKQQRCPKLGAQTKRSLRALRGPSRRHTLHSRACNAAQIFIDNPHSSCIAFLVGAGLSIRKNHTHRYMMLTRARSFEKDEWAILWKQFYEIFSGNFLFLVTGIWRILRSNVQRP